MNTVTKTDHVIQIISGTFVAAVVLLALLFAVGVTPAAPWSPIGHAEQNQKDRMNDNAPVVPLGAPVESRAV